MHKDYITQQIKMLHISLLLPENVNVAGFDNPRQGLLETNSYLEAQGKNKAFVIEIVGVNDFVEIANGNFSIKTDKKITEIERTDIIIIPPIQGDIEDAIKANAPLYPWIINQYRKGAQVVSLCLGAFLLAQTGLLNGKQCVTHWKAYNSFQQLYPKVKLVSEKIITDEDGIYTGGGAFSSANLMLYLIEKLVSRDVAIYCSKVFQIDVNRVSQSPFIIFNKQKEHGDSSILKVQQFIETNFTKSIHINQLCDVVSMGRRTFERRFKAATSNTPIEYIQRIRIEAAKKELENGLKTVNEIMYEVGYNDKTAFRDVFRKFSGVTPLDYRRKFVQSQSSS